MELQKIRMQYAILSPLKCYGNKHDQWIAEIGLLHAKETI